MAMSSKKSEEKNEAVQAVNVDVQTETDKNERKFKKEKLREKAFDLYGVTTSTFDGAMYGHTENEFTVKEAEEIIRKWQKGDKK